MRCGILCSDRLVFGNGGAQHEADAAVTSPAEPTQRASVTGIRRDTLHSAQTQSLPMTIFEAKVTKNAGNRESTPPRFLPVALEQTTERDQRHGGRENNPRKGTPEDATIGINPGI